MYNPNNGIFESLVGESMMMSAQWIFEVCIELSPHISIFTINIGAL